ncbi:MAG: heavy metal translocating P-type ATPase, partial [Candidatus Sericytochromatia bacterium]
EENTSGIEDVSVNFTAKTAKVKWDKNKTSLDEIFKIFNSVGYSSKPVDKTRLSEISTEKNRNLMIQMAVAGFATLATMFLAEPFYFDYVKDLDHSSAMMLQYISLAFTTPVFFYTIRPFFKGFLSSFKFGLLTMDTTIFIGASLIYSYSLWNIVNEKTPVYFDCLTMFIFLILLGRFIEAIIKQKVFIKVEQNLRSYPKQAIVIRDQKEILVDVDEIREEEVVMVRTGEQIPVDGQIIYGFSNVNEAVITGESTPLFKQEGDKVIAGSVNLDGLLHVKTEKAGQKTTLNKIVELTDILRSKRGNFQRFSDKIGNILIISSFVIAFGAYFYNRDINPEFALLSAISVIIATCPCAIGLAMPAAISIATSSALKKGILFKDPDSFEKISKMKNLILDKTGTITSGKLEFSKIVTFNGYNEKDILKYASSVSRFSEHPISFAIVAQANKDKVDLKKAINYQSIPGKGLKGEVDNIQIITGNRSFLESFGIKIDFEENNEDMTEVFVSLDNKFVGVMFFSDKLKEDAQDTIKFFQDNVKVSLLSGDKNSIVSKLANSLNIDFFQAQTTPKDKADYIKNIKKDNEIICMVGDGINDTPAMAQADIGISLSSNNDLAKINSDIIILNNSTDSLKQIFLLSSKTYSIIKQNMLISLLYNSIVIPLAVTGNITPLIASLLMPFSSLLVLVNSLRIIKES